nr:hypothetical protein [Halalkalirubrum salinum]
MYMIPTSLVPLQPIVPGDPAQLLIVLVGVLLVILIGRLVLKIAWRLVTIAVVVVAVLLLVTTLGLL